MGLALGIGATFLGVIFAISGYSGGGTANMNKNLIAMMKGEWLPSPGPNTPGSNTQNTSTSSSKSGNTSTTGGTYGNSGSGTSLGPGTNE